MPHRPDQARDHCRPREGHRPLQQGLHSAPPAHLFIAAVDQRRLEEDHRYQGQGYLGVELPRGQGNDRPPPPGRTAAPPTRCLDGGQRQAGAPAGAFPRLGRTPTARPPWGQSPPSRCGTTPAGWARVSTLQCPRIANPPQHRPVMVKVQSRKLPNARFMTHTLPGFSFLHPVSSITQGPGPAKKNPPRNGGKSVQGGQVGNMRRKINARER